MKHLILFLTENPEVVEETFNFGEYIQKLFTPELITAIISLATTFFTILKVVGVVKNLARANKGTIADVINAVQSKMDEQNDLNITKVISPLANKMTKIEDTEEILIKVLALMQEKTPESKLAILNLLQSIGKVQDETIVNAKANVEKQELEQKENKEQALKDLEKIENQEEVKGRI